MTAYCLPPTAFYSLTGCGTIRTFLKINHPQYIIRIPKFYLTNPCQLQAGGSRTAISNLKLADLLSRWERKIAEPEICCYNPIEGRNYGKTEEVKISDTFTTEKQYCIIQIYIFLANLTILFGLVDKHRVFLIITAWFRMPNSNQYLLE